MTHTNRPVGSIWYLSGSRTKVEIVKDNQGKSLCKIIGVSDFSKFKGLVGKERYFSNRVLYPRNDNYRSYPKNE